MKLAVALRAQSIFEKMPYINRVKVAFGMRERGAQHSDLMTMGVELKTHTHISLLRDWCIVLF